MGSSVNRQKDGDKRLDARWNRLYADQRAPLYRAATFLVGPTEGEEVVQDAFERAMKRDGFFEDVREPAAWLRQVVVRLAVTRLRRRALWDRIRPLLSAPNVSGDSDLALSIRRLPPTQRGAILLHYYFGASYGEVATSLGLRRTSVGKTLARARAALREDLR